jgi:putative ABC transport system substrate-binding protein
MKRREFITLLGGATVAWPLGARAQQPDGVRRIGVLIGTLKTDPESEARVAAFEQGLHALGWTIDRNVHIDYRFGSADPALTQKYAAELVGMAPDVILANSPLVLRALHQQTSTIPIVFALVVDPVGEGFMAHPGGNITGLAGGAQGSRARRSWGSRYQPLRKRHSGRIHKCIGERGVSGRRAVCRNACTRCR